MKIIQLNIWQGKIGRNISTFLEKEQPDIVCMQEVSILEGPSGALFMTLDEIQERTQMKYVSTAPTFSVNFMNRECYVGNAIFSNLPISDEKVTFVNGEFTEKFDWEEHDYNVRNMQTCAVTLPNGKQLNLLNHHGYHEFQPDGTAKSITAMQKVADQARSLPHPLIVCGDFNVHPQSPPMRAWDDSGLRNLVVEHKLTNSLGKLHYLDKEVLCDYIFVSNDIQVKSFRAEDPLVSDHKALILEFDI